MKLAKKRVVLLWAWGDDEKFHPYVWSHVVKKQHKITWWKRYV